MKIINYKKSKRISLSIFFLVYISYAGYSQVGGISGSKLAAVSVNVIDHNNIEFEPAFAHFNSNGKWNNEGQFEDLFGSSDSVRHTTGFNFRFTYGLWDKLEIGASISTDLERSNWGLRYIVYSKKKLGFALIAGANIPFDNKDIDKSLRLANNLTSVGGGVVMTTQFSENLSLDFNAQYQAFIKETKEEHKGSYYLNAELGYYLFNHQFQIIGGLGYQQSIFNEFTDKVLTVFPGVTIETGKNYMIVISTPFDVYGENSIKNTGFVFALTLTFD